jgi:flavin-binding protein dodecin
MAAALAKPQVTGPDEFSAPAGQGKLTSTPRSRERHTKRTLRRTSGCPLTRGAESVPEASKGVLVTETVYKVIELVGTSTDSWERAATAAVERAGSSLRDLRVAEIVELDMQLEDGQVMAYRAKVKVSFKYAGGS